MILKPQKLSKGDCVAVVAPAKRLEQLAIEKGITVIENWGFNVIQGIHILGEYFYFSGTEQERKQDLQTAINDPSIKAIFCARGGFGTSKIVDQLDFSPLSTSPKWFIGFSDITVLHLHLSRLGIPSLHANMLALFYSRATQASMDTIKKHLFGEPLTYKWLTKKVPLKKFQNKEGITQGQVIGGNLTVICHCIGTPSEPSFENKILFLEDVGEPYYAIDRYLTQLQRAHKLNQLKGVIVGAFNGSSDDDDFPFVLEPYEIIYRYFAMLEIPLAFQFPAGHIANNLAIPFGVEATLTVSGNDCTLTFDRHPSS